MAQAMGPPPASPQHRPAAAVRDFSHGELSAPPVLKRDRVAAISIIFVAFSAALIISWKATEAVKPNVAAAPAPVTSEGLAGYPGHVDPTATLSLARKLSERRQLRRFVVNGVGADGTVDLDQAGANIRYEFDSAAGEGPEAPRPPGSVRPGHFCGRQTVHVKKEGIYAEPDQPRTPCRANAGEPLPEPRCTLQRLWELARDRRAPSDARATVEYFRAEDGPAWRFSLPGAAVRFTVSGDCERELDGRAGRPLLH
jgi:hypothetical protein